MKHSTRDVYVSIVTVLAGFAVIVTLIFLTGCASVEPCPPISVPEVVQIPVAIPPDYLPNVLPPAFVEPVTISDIASNWLALVRAYKEAVAIIESHNSAIIDDP